MAAVALTAKGSVPPLPLHNRRRPLAAGCSPTYQALSPPAPCPLFSHTLTHLQVQPQHCAGQNDRGGHRAGAVRARCRAGRAGAAPAVNH